MATKTNRKARRAANAKARKGGENNGQPVKAEEGAKTVPFNRNHKTMVAARKQGVANETTTQAHGVIDLWSKAVDAVRDGGMMATSAHAALFLNDIRRDIVKARRADGNNADVGEVNASRASDGASILKLAQWTCVDALFATLRSFDTLSLENLVKVSQFVRGTSKGVTAWNNTLKAAPSRATLAKIIRKNKTRKPRGGKRGARGKSVVVGMPGDPQRGLLHCLKCMRAFDKAHGKLLDASQRKIVTSALDGFKKLETPIKAAMKKAETDVANAALKAKAKS